MEPSASEISVRYKNGDRERPEFTGSVSFATGPDDDEFSSVSLRVRGRYGDNWSPWGPTSGLLLQGHGITFRQP